MLDKLPIADYHARPELSNSGLNDFAKSPLHYHALHLDPARPAREETAAQLVGNLAHCMILEPGEFANRYAVGPCDDKRLAMWKSWDAARAKDDRRQAIKLEQYEAAVAMAASARRLADVDKLLSSGRPEVSAFWTDPATKVKCRCRPDWVHPVGNRGVILADVKTCGDASPAEFSRQVARMGYHRQAVFYSDGYEAASGIQVLGFAFIAIETAWPYAASAVMLDDESLEKGRVEIAEMLPRFAACLASGVWPGYSEGIELIRLPAWKLAA